MMIVTMMMGRVMMMRLGTATDWSRNAGLHHRNEMIMIEMMVIARRWG